MRLFKSKDDVADPFTLVTEKGDVYGFSSNPFSPTGIGIFSHTCENLEVFLRELSEIDNQEEIQFEDLPTRDAKMFVRNRISPENLKKVLDS